MQTTLIGSLITALLKFLKDDKEIKIVVDALLDKVEERIANSETKIDDYTVLPLINLIRQSFNVPDNDKNVTIKTDSVQVNTTIQPKNEQG